MSFSVSKLYRSDQYDGVIISADNFDPNSKDYAVIYDTSPRVGDKSGLSNEDPDLIGPNWGNSNMVSANSIELGGVLIIQENNIDCITGVCSSPDDEGTRPAGRLSFDFKSS